MTSPFFIAGPCVIETEALTLSIAQTLKEICSDLGVSFLFKASFDKANRTSYSSFRGLGMDEGLRILERVKADSDVEVITDIHLPQQAESVAEVADYLQIPAFLCRQTDLLVAAAKTGKPILVKKAQFLAPWDMKSVVQKIEESGNKRILLCERGTAFGYNTLVVDMTSIPEMKKLGYPVVFDATHSVQKPGSKGASTGGNRDYVEPLALAAIAAGADAVFIETHPEPGKALSDSSCVLELSDVKPLLGKIKAINSELKSWTF